MHKQLVYHLSEKEIEDSGYSLFQQQSLICLIQLDEFKKWMTRLPIPVLYMAFNNTLLLYYRYQINRIEHYHVDDRVLVKELVLDGFRIDEVFMFSDRHVGIWAFDFVGSGYWLVQWNLETEELIKHRWRTDALQKQHSVKLLAFSHSRLLCVVLRNCGDEKKSADKNQLSISYVKFPLASQTVELAHHYEFTEHSLRKYQFPDKFNDHSAIVWRKAHDSSEPDFSTLHIFSLGSQQIRDYKIDHFFVEKGGWYSAEISDLWEPKEGIVYVEFRQFLSYPKMQKSLQIQSLPCQQRRNYKWLKQPITKEKWHQFFWDMTQNKLISLKQGVHQAEEYSNKLQFTNGFRKTHHFCPFTSYTYPTHTRLLFKPRILQFVNIYSGQTIAKQKIPEKRMFSIEEKDQVKYYYPQHDCFTQISYQINQINDCQFTFNRKLEIVITTRKMLPFPFPISFYIVFLMTELIQDCDDDLLDSVIKVSSFEN